MRSIVVGIIAFLLLGHGAGATVVVNEVMSYAPSVEPTLEWIELYNPSSSQANLLYYRLGVYSELSSDFFSLTGTLGAGEYLVLCRNSVLFEQHWGDNSGVWGDAAVENYTLLEIHFQLANSSGHVSLIDLTPLQPQVVSDLAWTQSGLEGYSWERVYYSTNEVGQSIDPSGSTPGRINSLTPMQIDLALEGVEMIPENGLTTIGFRIVNRGLTDVPNPILELYKFDPNGPYNQGVLLDWQSIGPVDSGQTVILIAQYQFDCYYQKLVGSIVLFTDQRPDNNRLTFTAPGEEYPPVILSEFLPAQEPSTASEWVELKNISDSVFDLNGWQLGDSVGLAEIASSELLIRPLEYLVLAEDSTAFRLTYPDFAGDLFQPPAWRFLNNGSDSVRLYDVFNIEADKFYYDRIFEGNHTWAKSEAPGYEGQWGRSEDVGGTPGAPNRVRFTPEGSRTLRIDVTPRIISPDGDGRDDSTVIRIQASEAKSYTLRLYDSQGRLVRTLEEDVPDLKEYYVWRGESDSGEHLPIGIYILYVETVGVESAKTTIVVAR